MVMSGVFMILMTAGQVGMGVALRAGGLNLNFADQATTTWASAAQTVVMRSVNAISGADSPLQQWLPPLRNHAFLELLGQPNAPYDNPFHEYIRYTSADIATINSQAKLHQINRVDRQLIFISSVVTLIVVETLFAFRSLLCVKPSHLFWLSVSRFGVIAGHLWCLRLVIVGLKAILIFTPMAIVGRYSYLAHDLDWGWFGSPLQGYTWVICLALINAIISTFEAVYVAQVYRALLESDKCERNSQQSELIFTRLRPDSVPQALERQ